jgi:hypothetical protein
MSTDLTFITNEKDQNLKERFEVLIKDTKLFDCLVGYFYTSGFHAIYKSLDKTERIRILIGISTSRQTYVANGVKSLFLTLACRLDTNPFNGEAPPNPI